MNPTASAKGMSLPADLPMDDVTPEEKLVCLGSWLERTTMKETQAAQACAILPASMLTIGTAFAGIAAGIDHQGSALVIFLGFVFGALTLFLHHHRRLSIWKAVAVRLQSEQKLMIGAGRVDNLQKAGRHPPEKLAQWFDKREPLRFLSGPALALYFAVFVLGTTLLVFAVGRDEGGLHPRQAAASEGPSVGKDPWGVRRPVF